MGCCLSDKIAGDKKREGVRNCMDASARPYSSPPFPILPNTSRGYFIPTIFLLVESKGLFSSLFKGLGMM